MDEWVERVTFTLTVIGSAFSCLGSAMLAAMLAYVCGGLWGVGGWTGRAFG